MVEKIAFVIIICFYFAQGLPANDVSNDDLNIRTGSSGIISSKCRSGEVYNMFSAECQEGFKYNGR